MWKKFLGVSNGDIPNSLKYRHNNQTWFYRRAADFVKIYAKAKNWSIFVNAKNLNKGDKNENKKPTKGACDLCDQKYLTSHKRHYLDWD